MTDVKRRPGGEGHDQGGEVEPGRFESEHTPGRLDDVELLAEAHRLVSLVLTGVRRRHGRIPGVGTARWWAAGDDVKVATLLILSEAWLIHDPDRAVRERLREMSYDLSAGHDWTEQSRRPSHAELKRRRGEAA
ncbi:MAG: hypothetical protein GEV09_05890 [Pseudonocardiaceae bacterium]|nr:hypothetical protein [Pseudonocardiaceae bacterium]